MAHYRPRAHMGQTNGQTNGTIRQPENIISLLTLSGVEVIIKMKLQTNNVTVVLDVASCCNEQISPHTSLMVASRRLSSVFWRATVSFNSRSINLFSFSSSDNCCWTALCDVRSASARLLSCAICAFNEFLKHNCPQYFIRCTPIWIPCFNLSN